MALTGGTVTIDDDGTETKSGIASDIYDRLVTETEAISGETLPSGPAGAPARKGIAALANVSPIVISFHWGCDWDSAGFYAVANGSSLDSDSSAATSYVVEHIAPMSGKLRAFTWTTAAADDTTDLKVWVNGAAVETVKLDAAIGVMDLSDLAVTAGQGIRVEWDAGTAPGQSHCAIYMSL